ncbi:MAG: hypothetical protein AAGI53_11710 [Planctomycetota bacterium]
MDERTIPRFIFAAMLAAIILPACTSVRAPYQPRTGESQDTTTARNLNSQAADIMESAPDQAEALLRDALTADVYFGPAHNNLGVLLMQRGELYGAANEFEWARRLLPGHPDPRLNLGMTLELAGKTADAMDAYRSALEVYPGYLPAIMALTRAELRTRHTTDDTKSRLEDIALRSMDPTWSQWAEVQLTRLSP